MGKHWPYDYPRQQHLRYASPRHQRGFLNDFSKGADYLIWFRLHALSSIHRSVQKWFPVPRPSVLLHPTLDQKSGRVELFAGTGSEGNRDGLAKRAEFYQLTGLCVASDHARTSCIKQGFYNSNGNCHISGCCGEDLQGVLHS